MLRIDHASMTFNPGTVHERRALDSLSLHVPPGDFVTLIGGNGAGKSTLFNLIAGVFFPDSGRVTLGGEDITFQPEHKRAHSIGRLLQDPMAGTAPSMTIEENIALATLRNASRRWAFGMNRQERAHARDRLATLGLGLENRMRTRMGLLSGGERQAVSLVMSTIVQPKLLLLDEHTAALDPQTADIVLNITRRLVHEGSITTLMITHNIGTALTLGNRLLMLDEGEIVLDLDAAQKANLSVEDLLALFAAKRKKKFDVDRALL